MSYFNRIDDEHLVRMLAFQKMSDKYFSDRANEYVDMLDRELARKTLREKKWIADKFSEMQLIDKTRDFSNDEKLLIKTVNVLTALGYSDLSRELGAFAEKISRCITASDIYINEIIDGSIKKHRRVSASGSRHDHKEEIVNIIRTTWQKYPWGSRAKMIKYVTKEFRVSEKSIKDWMKEHGLNPLEKSTSDDYALVLSSKK